MCVSAANRSFRSSAFHVTAKLAHLSCAHELKGSESGLQVGGVGLKIVESASDACLKLGRLRAGGTALRYLAKS